MSNQPLGVAGRERSFGPLWVVVPALLLAVWVVGSRLVGGWPLDIHLRDDAYYYFSWARSLAAGEGPCVTPGVATSGVHVLWPLLLAAVVWVVGAAALPSVSVGLGFAMHAASAVLLYRLAAPARGLGLTVAAAYAGSPYLADEVRHGQTALACLGLLVFVGWHRRGTAAFLATGALAVAARSDLIFLVAAAACAEPAARRRRLLATVGILLAYAVGNLVLAGHWLQDSARPIPWLLAAEFSHSGGDPWLRFWTYCKPILLGIPFRLSSTPLALAWLLAALIGWWRRDRRLAWWLIGGVGLVCLHNLWRYYPRDYYFAPLAVVGAVAVLELHRCGQRGLAWSLLALALVWNARHLPDHLRTHPAQREMALAGRLLERFLPAGEPVGCFNAGLVTWHHPGRVVNLDGVVNRPAFEALRRGALGEYLAAQGVHYLLDNPVQFAREGIHSNGRHFGGSFDAGRDLRECVRFHWPAGPTDRGRAGIGWFSLYRLREGGADWQPVSGLRDLGDCAGGRAIAWAGIRGRWLRVNGRNLFRAPQDLVYVLSVAWDRHAPLRLSDGTDEGRLVIAPD